MPRHYERESERPNRWERENCGWRGRGSGFPARNSGCGGPRDLHGRGVLFPGGLLGLGAAISGQINDRKTLTRPSSVLAGRTLACAGGRRQRRRRETPCALRAAFCRRRFWSRDRLVLLRRAFAVFRQVGWDRLCFVLCCYAGGVSDWSETGFNSILRRRDGVTSP